jgi:hypothetical protein
LFATAVLGLVWYFFGVYSRLTYDREPNGAL